MKFEFLTTISRYRLQAEAEVYYAKFDDYINSKSYPELVKKGIYQEEDIDSPIRDISRQFYISPSRKDMFKFIKELRNDFDYYYDNLHTELSSLEASINIESITLRDLKIPEAAQLVSIRTASRRCSVPTKLNFIFRASSRAIWRTLTSLVVRGRGPS